MNGRTLPVVLSLFLCLVAVRALPAQDVPAGAEQPPTRAGQAQLAERVADLQGEVARLKQQLKELQEQKAKQPADPATRPQVKIYALKNADATQLAKTIHEVFDPEQRGRLRLVADPQTNSIILHAHAEDMAMVEAVLLRLDGEGTPAAAPAARPQVKIHVLKNAAASRLVPIVQELFDPERRGRLRIVDDQRTNSIIVMGQADDLQAIEAVIKRLDELPAAAPKDDRRPGLLLPEEINKLREAALADIQGRIAIAQADLEMWKERLAWSERMVKKGFLTAQQAAQEQARLKTAELLLEKLRQELKALTGASEEPAKKPQPNK
jgi:hypothetical protein